jgi:hypothetical protein
MAFLRVANWWSATRPHGIPSEDNGLSVRPYAPDDHPALPHSGIREQATQQPPTGHFRRAQFNSPRVFDPGDPLTERLLAHSNHHEHNRRQRHVHGKETPQCPDHGV